MRKLNKKAIGTFSLLISAVLAVALLVFAIVFIFFPVISNYYVTTSFSTQHLRYDVVSARIFNAPECLAYEHEIEHWSLVHAGVIDSGKFKTAQLSNCLSSSDDYRGTKYHINFIKDMSSPTDNVVTNVAGGITEENIDEFTTATFLVNYIEAGKSYPEDIKTGIMEVSLRL